VGEPRSVLFVIDVEPDSRKALQRAGGWVGTARAVRYVADLRKRLEDRTHRPVLFNWFLRTDPQIRHMWGHAEAIAEACPYLLRTIEDHGDYCGIHPHLWRRHPGRSEWFNDFVDPAWTEECLGTAIDGFHGILQRSPEACRFGDRWLSQHAVEQLQGAGILYDLTVEPGVPDEPIPDDPHATGRVPDYSSSPRTPYQPSAENFLVPRALESPSGALWMIPLTTSPPVWRWLRRPPHLLKASRTVNVALPSLLVWPHLRSELERPSPVPLTVVIRSGDLENDRHFMSFLRTTDRLARHPGVRQLEFTDPATAIARWQRQ